MENMETISKLKHIRISPQKIRFLCDLIRGKNINNALAIVTYTKKSSSPIIYKLLLNAIANAKNNYKMDVNKLYVSKIFVTPGSTMKRMMPRAQGRAYKILKRSSHLTIGVMEKI